MRIGRQFAYCLGSFANTLADQARTRVIYFYNVEAGLPPSYTGLIWAIYGIWNAINDPVMGQITDRTRSRWGRRVPYLLFGAIPLGISFYLLWTPPMSIRAAAPIGKENIAPAAEPDPGNMYLLAAYFFAALFVFDALFTMTIIAYNALFTEMTRTPVERSRLSALREGFGVIALILAAFVPLLANKLGYAGMGLLLGIATSIGYLVAVAGVGREHHQNPTTPEPGLIESLRITFAFRPFRFFLAANLCKELIFIVPPATLGYYCRYAVPVKDSLQESLLLLIPFLLTIPSLFVGSRLTPILGTQRAWMLTFLSFIPGCVIMALAPNYWIAQIGTALIAPGLAGLMMLPHMMISEIIDDDARRTGRRRAGAFYGVSGAMVKLGIVLHAVILFGISSATGFITRSAANPNPVQPESAAWGIRFMMGGVPALVSVLGILFLIWVRVPPADPSDDSPASR